MLQGAAKGGRKTGAGLNPGKFTSETASKASKKCWSTRWRLNKRIGIRLGRTAKRAATLDRALLRNHYSRYPAKNIRCCYWRDAKGNALPFFSWELTENGSIRAISERTALQRLGHLPKKRKHWQPGPEDTIVKVVTGLHLARKKKHE